MLVSSPPKPPPSQCTAEWAIILAIPFRAIFENLLCGHCGEYVRKIPSNVVGWLLCGGRGLATWQGFECNRIYALHVCFMNLHDTHDLGDRHWTSDGGLHIHTSTPQPCNNAAVNLGWMFTKEWNKCITPEYIRVVSHSWNPHKVYSFVVVHYSEQRNALYLNSWVMFVRAESWLGVCYSNMTLLASGCKLKLGNSSPFRHIYEHHIFSVFQDRMIKK